MIQNGSKADGNEIRASLPPAIQKQIKMTQEIRKRESIDPSTGMIHCHSRGERKVLNPLIRLSKLINFFKRRHR
jgi:hypothetical protein